MYTYKLTSVTPVYQKIGDLYTYEKVEVKPARWEILSNTSLTTAERDALLSYYGYAALPKKTTKVATFIVEVPVVERWTRLF